MGIEEILGNKRLIVVSNREPYSNPSKNVFKKTVGGLVSALDSMLSKYGGLWIAHGSGKADFQVTENSKIRLNNYVLKRIKLSEREVINYYRGFSNRVLWPTFHFFPQTAVFNPIYWNFYKKVNEKFARAILKEKNRDDLIWIHDYHLTLVPSFVRKEKKNARIAFFLHIPFPSYEIFSEIPWNREIIESLLDSDLIGFHTQDYVENFLRSVKKIGIKIKNDKIKLGGREIKVKAFPLGIDYKWFSHAEPSEKIKSKIFPLNKKSYVILGVDRLDYTKGILERLLAFEKFLKYHREFREKVVLIQIASPSRTRIEEYKSLRRKINEIVGRIFGEKYKKLEWTPIHYFYHSFSPKELLAFYKKADVALITPLRDGMNLVSKEYVASHDTNGVLILSKFTGAASQLKEALLVNPYNIEETADAIYKALTMPLEEKEKRFKALKRRVKKENIWWWMENFLREWISMY